MMMSHESGQCDAEKSAFCIAPTTVLLVDDEPRVLRGMEMLISLAPDLAVVGTASTGTAALALARRHHPDVVVMDVRLPEMDGITATRYLRHEAPGSKVIILSLYGDRTTRYRAALAGAVGFVSKQETHAAVLSAIREAIEPG